MMRSTPATRHAPPRRRRTSMTPPLSCQAASPSTSRNDTGSAGSIPCLTSRSWPTLSCIAANRNPARRSRRSRKRTQPLHSAQVPSNTTMGPARARGHDAGGRTGLTSVLLTRAHHATTGKPPDARPPFRATVRNRIRAAPAVPPHPEPRCRHGAGSAKSTYPEAHTHRRVRPAGGVPELTGGLRRPRSERRDRRRRQARGPLRVAGPIPVPDHRVPEPPPGQTRGRRSGNSTQISRMDSTSSTLRRASARFDLLRSSTT